MLLQVTRHMFDRFSIFNWMNFIHNPQNIINICFYMMYSALFVISPHFLLLNIHLLLKNMMFFIITIEIPHIIAHIRNQSISQQKSAQCKTGSCKKIAQQPLKLLRLKSLVFGYYLKIPGIVFLQFQEFYPYLLISLMRSS